MTQKLFTKTKLQSFQGTTNGAENWGASGSARVVIGLPAIHETQAGDGIVSECLCFNEALTETQIFEIYDTIFAPYG